MSRRVDKVAFVTNPDRGYTITASYLLEPNKRDALVEVCKNGAVVKEFLYPAYRVWNIAAHSGEVVDAAVVEDE